MKPFNLQEALAGKPVVTRDGRPVKIAGYNPDARYCDKITGWVDNISRDWSNEGRYYISGESNFDLFMASEKRTYWVNVYKKMGGFYESGQALHESEKIAKESIVRQWNYIGTYSITIEE